MKKIYKLVFPVLKGFVFMAMAVQIFLGMLYIGNNFLAVPRFQETERYLTMAQTLVIDEYAGILYPLLIRLFEMLPWISFQIPLYVLQIFMGLFSVYHFASAWTERKGVAVTCALWINTIPFVAQAHVTVLPHSLAFSLLALMLLTVVKGTRFREALTYIELAVVLCSYVFLVQLGREYFWPGTLLVIWAVLLQLYAKQQRASMLFLYTLLSVGVLVSNVAVYRVTQTEGSYGRMTRSFESTFFLRTGMSIMEERFMIYMPEEIRANFDGKELEEMAKFPYKIQTQFGPTLEANYGKEGVRALYWKMGLLGLGNATKDTLKGIAEDAVGYGLPAGMYFNWRNGELKGITSWNYQQFIEQAPQLSVHYIKICQSFWSIGFGAAIAVGVIEAIRRRRLYLWLLLPVLSYVAAYGLYFAVQGTNVYDYKLALLPLALSYAWIACIFFREDRLQEENE